MVVLVGRKNIYFSIKIEIDGESFLFLMQWGYLSSQHPIIWSFVWFKIRIYFSEYDTWFPFQQCYPTNTAAVLTVFTHNEMERFFSFPNHASSSGPH